MERLCLISANVSMSTTTFNSNSWSWWWRGGSSDAKAIDNQRLSVNSDRLNIFSNSWSWSGSSSATALNNSSVTFTGQYVHIHSQHLAVGIKHSLRTHPSFRPVILAPALTSLHHKQYRLGIEQQQHHRHQQYQYPNGSWKRCNNHQFQCHQQWLVVGWQQC